MLFPMPLRRCVKMLSDEDSDWDELLEAVVVQLQFFWQSPRPALTSAGNMFFHGGERSHRLRPVVN